jgi:hypothetical protein
MITTYEKTCPCGKAFSVSNRQRKSAREKQEHCSVACARKHKPSHLSHGLTKHKPKGPGHRYFRLWHIYKTYGITGEQFEAMYQEQYGRCLICQKGEATCVDHNHETKKIRGLLCRKCNAAIGILGEDPELLERAANYLRTS